MPDDWTVMVVDDHPMFRQGVVATQREAEGFSVVAEVDSLAEARVRFRLTRPTVVLLDIALPDGNGVELVPEVLAEAPDTRIAMLTSADDTDTVLNSLRAGAAGYIVKGTSASDLVAALRAICKGEGYTSPALASRLLQAAARHQPDHVDELSGREREVFDLLGEGLTNREIAERLFLSEKTVKHYVTMVMQKVGARHRVEVALMAARQSGRH